MITKTNNNEKNPPLTLQGIPLILTLIPFNKPMKNRTTPRIDKQNVIVILKIIL